MAKHEQITLPAENASVQERQVTVRVLTIGTKQVTQTLYRQLLEESVIDEMTGCLKGNVWGWVNLHEEHCGSIFHYHVIWEDHGQLKRSINYPDLTTSDYYCKLEKQRQREEQGEDQLGLIQKEIEFLQNWGQSFKTIEQSGQLFVAVSGVWK